MNSIQRAYRTWKARRKFVRCGKGFRFHGTHLEVDGHVEVGDYCRFRNNSVFRTTGSGRIIWADRSGCSYGVILEACELIRIGTFTALAEYTVVRDSNHSVYGTDAHWRSTPLITRPVIIGNNVLIGSRVYIHPGVTIGDGAVVDAGSVVTKDIGPLEIWAGAPARKIAHRTQGVPERLLKRTQELIAKYGLKDDRYIPHAASSHEEDT